MAWVKLDDKRAINKKLRAVGFAARGLDEAAICWSSHEETDGFISHADLEMLATLHGCRKPQPLVDLLVREGRWSVTSEGWLIHDYLKFNPSHDDLENARQRDRDRKKSRGNPKAASSRIPDGIPPEWGGKP